MVTQSQVRMLRRERIIGDLGASTRQTAEQRTLARIRFADQPDISDHLQLENQPPSLAFFPRRALTRGLIRRRFEMGVPPAPSAAPRRDHPLARAGQILEQETVLSIDHDGSGRNVNDQILPTTAVTIRALTVRASLGPPELSVSQSHQTVHSPVRQPPRRFHRLRRRRHSDRLVERIVRGEN
jgi:hypothetical protein